MMPKVEMVGAAAAFFVLLGWLFWRLFGWAAWLHRGAVFPPQFADPHKAKFARVLSVVFGSGVVACVVLGFALCLMGAYLALTQ